MPNALITLAYRQVIDASATGTFERDVFTDSYNEFRLQIQTYNPDGQFTTWEQVRTAVPESVPTLPIKVGFAIGLYVRALGGQIPGLTDALGGSVLFADYQFDLLDSDITDRTKHRIALTYVTAPLTWLGTVGNYLLLTAGDQTAATDRVDTFMVAIGPNLSITSYAAR